MAGDDERFCWPDGTIRIRIVWRFRDDCRGQVERLVLPYLPATAAHSEKVGTEARRAVHEFHLDGGNPHRGQWGLVVTRWAGRKEWTISTRIIQPITSEPEQPCADPLQCWDALADEMAEWAERMSTH